MNDKEIYSDKITKGKRTYFFDIKKSEQGDLYLKVSESKKTSSGFEHYRLMVFEEDIQDFAELALIELGTGGDAAFDQHFTQAKRYLRMQGGSRGGFQRNDFSAHG